MNKGADAISHFPFPISHFPFPISHFTFHISHFPLDSSLAILIAAGGSGTRFGGNKLLAEFRGLPLFCHCLRNFDAPQRCFVLAVPHGLEASFQEALQCHLPQFQGAVHIIAGGASRSESIAKAFAFLKTLPELPAFIAIHDAARPLADQALLEQCVKMAQSCDGAIVAHRVTDTIHVADVTNQIVSTPDRNLLWAAETPQVFHTEIFERALQDADWAANPPTDDASLVKRLPGIRIKLVENQSPNPKITYSHDLELLQAK